jgi:homogentisate phytyltransferase/homogentisate geranylgeranyltransferase
MSQSQISSLQLPQPFSWLYSFWKFSRPHTIIGTTLSVWALFFIAPFTTSTQITSSYWLQWLGAWLACVSGNIYIVGLNQLEDIAIDRINKPHLPLAAAEFSLKMGKMIVVIAGILALILASFFGKWLLFTVGISLAIGTAYSLPPIRLKQFPFWAALCIFTVRGIIVNLGLSWHFTEKLTGKGFLTPAVWTLTLFILVFSVAIAIFKDVPDTEGDKEYNITTFTLILGKTAILNLSRWIISFCYLGTIAAGIIWLQEVNTLLLVISHCVLLILLWWRSQKVDLTDKFAIASFYQFIWRLFFLEYLLFPLVCGLGN